MRSMRTLMDSLAVLTMAAIIFLTVMTVCSDHETNVLTLKRMLPPSHEINLTQLTAFDSAQHGRLLQSPVRGAFNFPVEGRANAVLGLYYTTLKLGTPPREYDVVIDTGSDLVWVSCISCVGCPVLQSLFDPVASSSAVKIPCSDNKCYRKSGCSPRESCVYKQEYGDGSITSGFYISDVVSFSTVTGSNGTVHSSASFVFGCSDLQAGHFSLSHAIHGILGLGKGRESMISQLSSHRLAPRVFSHCLSGSIDSGGIMILGQNLLPRTVYTPLVRSQTHYNVDLRSIAVNDQRLAIDDSVFSVATGYGTIIDSGTVLAYFPVEAYDPLIQAISNVVSLYGRPITYDSYQCYNFTSATNSHLVVADMFPEVTLRFAGGASMVVSPKTYLLSVLPEIGNDVWCIAFRSQMSRRLTIIGEVALIDKMVTYDLVHQRIGWAEYNCSLDVTRGAQNRDVINTRQRSGDHFECSTCSLAFIALLLHLLIFVLGVL